MSRSSNRKAYASLLALLCSVILLNMGMTQFTYVRERLRVSHSQREGLNRKTFRAHALPALWTMSEGLVLSGAYSGTVIWENVAVKVERKEVIGDQHLLETLEARVQEHPEWGRLMSRRITTHGKTRYLFGGR